MRWILALLIALAPLAASAQDSGFSSLAGMPQPAQSVPPAEVVPGAVGASALYARQDHTHPRLTRATTVQTIVGGTFSGTWTAALASVPSLILTPIWASAGTMSCILTATPTTTNFQGKCTVDNSALLNLGIITTGLTIGPIAAGAGVSVQIIAVPPTQ